MVITPGAQALENIRIFKIRQLMGWMEEQGLQPEIVSFCDPTVTWLDFSLIIPTVGLVYLDFYKPVLQVDLTVLVNLVFWMVGFMISFSQ